MDTEAVKSAGNPIVPPPKKQPSSSISKPKVRFELMNLNNQETLLICLIMPKPWQKKPMERQLIIE